MGGGAQRQRIVQHQEDLVGWIAHPTTERQITERKGRRDAQGGDTTKGGGNQKRGRRTIYSRANN